MVINSEHMALLCAVLLSGRNGQISLMRSAVTDHCHCVLSLERGHTECEQHLTASKIE